MDICSLNGALGLWSASTRAENGKEGNPPLVDQPNGYDQRLMTKEARNIPTRYHPYQGWKGTHPMEPPNKTGGEGTQWRAIKRAPLSISPLKISRPPQQICNYPNHVAVRERNHSQVDEASLCWGMGISERTRAAAKLSIDLNARTKESIPPWLPKRDTREPALRSICLVKEG